MSLQLKITSFIRSLIAEILYGPGAKNLKKVLLSPIGILGSFFVFLSIIMSFIPEFTYLVSILWYVFFFIAVAESWNIIGGYGGEVDFGHVLFVGIGMYVEGMLIASLKFDIYSSIFFAGLVSAIVAILIGIPTLRLRGAYFAIAMLAFAESAVIIFNYFQMIYFNIFGFEIKLNINGGAGIDLGFLIRQIPNFRQLTFLLIVVVSMISFITTHYVSYTRLGLALRAIRDSPEGASSAGINVFRTKLIAFAISGFIAGMAGAVFGLRLFFFTPTEAFQVANTVKMIIITLVGGPGSVFGPIIGALIIQPLEPLLVNLFTGIKYTIFGFKLNLDVGYLLIYGLIFIFATFFLPRGIIGFLEQKGILKRESLIPQEDKPDA